MKSLYPENITDKTYEVFNFIKSKVAGQSFKLIKPLTNYVDNNKPFIVDSNYGELKLNSSRFTRSRNEVSILSCRPAVDKTDCIKRVLKDIHGEELTFDKVVYKGSKNDIIVTCPEHGDFEATPDNLVNSGTKCKDCMKISVDKFKTRADELHGGYYNYDKVDFTIGTYASAKITITCPIHGDFVARADYHDHGAGCKDCTKRDGWYNKATAEKNKTKWETIPAMVYLVRLELGEELFDKVGITVNDVRKRYSNRDCPYAVEELGRIETNLYEACHIEHKVKTLGAKDRYVPKLRFGGMYECFNKNTVTLIGNE